jgi:hypothetical protein
MPSLTAAITRFRSVSCCDGESLRMSTLRSSPTPTTRDAQPISFRSIDSFKSTYDALWNDVALSSKASAERIARELKEVKRE